MTASRLHVRVLVLSIAALLAACRGGPDFDKREGSPGAPGSEPGTEPATETDPKEPAEASKTGGTAGGDDFADSASEVGPECEAYLACCDAVAEEHPQMAGSCDSTREQIESAQAKGASTSSYESACKSALANMRRAGYCE